MAQIFACEGSYCWNKTNLGLRCDRLDKSITRSNMIIIEIRTVILLRPHDIKEVFLNAKL
jgi:hypothetical protein